MSLAEPIEHYQSALHRFGEVLSFEISPLDRSDIPVTSCSLVADGRMTQHGNGYGPTPEAATVSGLGELAEGVLSARLVGGLRDEAIRGSRRELVAAQGAARVADPPTLCLPAGSPYTPDMPLTWLPLRRVRTGETVWVPLDFVASDPAELAGEPALITPVSNGRGAGLDPARPIAHGVGEILQRHTNGLRFRALDRLSPVIDPDRLPPAVRDLLEGLRSRGIEPVLKHAATELGVVSTYAMGLDDDPASRIMLTACGEAAHPDAAVSLTKALLEYANSRVRKAFFFGSREQARGVAPESYWRALPTGGGESRELAAMRGWAELSTDELRRLTAPDQSRSVSYDAIAPEAPPDVSDQRAVLDGMLTALADHDVLAGTIDVDGVVVAKTVVAGLDVETLSYGRIGELGVRTALEAELDLVRVQPAATESHGARVHLTAEAEERIGGQAWYSYAVAQAIVGPLYPLYREPPRHSVEV